ncbi:MAG: hypothetical protein LQ352_006442, partial [Teloschistes flavicans]
MLAHQFLSFLLILPSLIQASAVLPPRAAPSQPAAAQDDDDNACPNYSTCGSKGLQYLNDLTTTLANPSAIDRTDGLPLFQTYYAPEYDLTIPVWPSLWQSFENRAINPEGSDVWEVNSLNPSNQLRDKATAYYNTFATHAGVLIAENNWRASDTQKKLPWSEIVYQTWRLAAAHADTLNADDDVHPPGAPIAGLRSVVRHSVVNAGTKAVVSAAYAANEWAAGGDGEDEWREWTEASTPAFFYGLLGTDNVKGVLWLLKDHAVEMGRKEVTKVWTRWHEMPGLDI